MSQQLVFSDFDICTSVTIGVIDYGCEDRKKAGELREDIGAVR
jgi:hypothetical protein